MGLKNSHPAPHPEADLGLLKALPDQSQAPPKPTKEESGIGSMQKGFEKVFLTERHLPMGGEDHRVSLCGALGISIRVASWKTRLTR